MFCVPVFQRSALDIRTVAPHQKRLKTESLQQGHLPSYEEPRSLSSVAALGGGGSICLSFFTVPTHKITKSRQEASFLVKSG